MKIIAVLSAAAIGAGTIAFSTFAGAMPLAPTPSVRDGGLVVQVQCSSRRTSANPSQQVTTCATPPANSAKSTKSANSGNGNRSGNRNGGNRQSGNNRGGNNQGGGGHRDGSNAAAIAAGIGLLGGLIASQAEPEPEVEYIEEPRRRRDRCRHGSWIDRDGYRHCRR